jgi:hypothetical protein
MPAAVYDLFIEQGATFSFSITMTNEDASVFDLTLWTPRAMLRKKYADVSGVSFTCAKDTPTGIITVSLTPSQTKALDTADYKWDLEIYQGTPPSETDVRRLLKGIATVDPEATK